MSSKVEFYIKAANSASEVSVQAHSVKQTPRQRIPAQFFTRYREGSTVHTKCIRETPTARPACVDTNQMFLSMRKGQSAGDCQSTEEMEKKKNEKTTFPPTTYVFWVPLSSHSHCASAIALPDSLYTSTFRHIRVWNMCRTNPPSHSRSKQLVLTAHQYCCSRDAKDSTAVKELFYQFLSQLNSLFLNSMHAPCNSTPPACQISTI